MYSAAYSLPVKIGNWYEEQSLQEAKLSEYREKRSNGSLLSQKNAEITEALSQPTNLAVSSEGEVKFGDRAVIVNEVRGEMTCLALGLSPVALLASSNKPGTNPKSSQKAPAGLTVNCTGSGQLSPVQRNTYIIRGAAQDGTVLTYGEPFSLLNQNTVFGEMRVYCEGSRLYSASPSTAQATLTGGRVALQCQHAPVMCANAYPQRYDEWVAQYFDPAYRMEYEGTPVKANEPLILTHKKTGRHLALERQYSMQTIFGKELEVSCHIYLDSHKAEKPANIWILATRGHGAVV